VAKKYPSDKLDQYIVRFPEGMRDKIKAAAEAKGRSMNAEIITRLEASLAGATGGLGAIDQIFGQAIQGLLSRPEPPSPKIMKRLEHAHATYRQLESQQLRDFLDLIKTIDEGEDIFGMSQEDWADRAREYEINELRSRAHSLGFDLVENDDTDIHVFVPNPAVVKKTDKS